MRRLYCNREEEELMNIMKLKGKIVEMGYNVEMLAKKVGIDRATLYRKLDCSEKFTIGEVQEIKNVLSLSNEELNAIFFD
jgi:DNA-binding phage protein